MVDVTVELRECPACGQEIWSWDSGVLHTHVDPVTGVQCPGSDDAAAVDDDYVLSLRENEGCTFAEIAADLGMSSEGARHRYLAARGRDERRRHRRQR